MVFQEILNLIVRIIDTVLIFSSSSCRIEPVAGMLCIVARVGFLYDNLQPLKRIKQIIIVTATSPAYYISLTT